jgi:predicted outer membrane repeat protein
MVKRLIALIGIALATAGASIGGANGRSAVDFTVNSRLDAVDAVPGDRVCRTRAGVCTLRAALNEAGALPSGGTPVVIAVPSGTFALRLDPPAARIRDEQGGDLDLLTHAAAPPAITITGAGAGRTIIEQLKADRVLELRTVEPVTIANLTIRGGHGVRQGGGIENAADGGLTLRGVEVKENVADQGGGVYSVRMLTIDRSRISDNDARTAGGGLGLTTHGGAITESTVSGNTAGRIGGGIWAQNVDSLELTQSLIADNSVTTPGARNVPPAGGGITVATDPALGIASSVRIAYSTIRDNFADLGGGLAWQAPGTLTVEESLFTANTAERGGAIATQSSGRADATNTLTLLNSTLTGNAAERGGAIERAFGSTILRAVTIAGNSALAGSGIDFNGARLSNTAATGTILANVPAPQNCSTNGAPFQAGEALSASGANLESGGGCHLRSPDLSGVVPRLGPLAANGGPTGTRALLPGSPALDRYRTDDCPSVDQRGFARPVGAGCDIGAFESGGVESIERPAPLRPRRDVVGGRLILTAYGTDQAPSLADGDYRPCGPGPAGTKRRLSKLVADGFFQPRDAQLVTRGALLLRRDDARAVRFANLLVVLGATRGRVLALLAPGTGAVPLFDVVGLGYGPSSVHGRLRLTAPAATLLDRQLQLQGFRAGMPCGRLDLRVSVARDPGPPPFAQPPPPPPPAPPPPPLPPVTFSLKVVVEPEDSGSVESNPEAVSCTDVCLATFAQGTVVRLTAVPAKGMEFDNWLGDCRGDGTLCTLTIDANKAVTAKFREKRTAPLGSGTPGPPARSGRHELVPLHVQHAGDELAADRTGWVLRRVHVHVVAVRIRLDRLDQALGRVSATLRLVGGAERDDDGAGLAGRRLVNVRSRRLVDPGDALERPADRPFRRA